MFLTCFLLQHAIRGAVFFGDQACDAVELEWRTDGGVFQLLEESDLDVVVPVDRSELDGSIGAARSGAEGQLP